MKSRDRIGPVVGEFPSVFDTASDPSKFGKFGKLGMGVSIVLCLMGKVLGKGAALYPRPVTRFRLENRYEL